MPRTKEEIQYDINCGSKVCSQCDQRKPFDGFHRKSESPDGRAGICIKCKTEDRRSYHLNYAYGITEEHYFTLLDEQWGCCAICGSDDETIGGHLHVDHNHHTGDVRGLLCSNCNTGLGLLQDNPDTLKSAIRYLYSSKELRRNKLMLVKGKAMWAHVQTPDDRFPPAKYSITVEVDDDQAKELRDTGLRVKKENDKNIFKVKRNVLKVDGSEAGKPNVVDAATEPFNDLIGNGSEVIVQIRPYEYSNNFGSGMSADLVGVQVVDLVPYEGEGGGGSEFKPLEEL